MTFHVAVGDTARFSKTVGESDVLLFAGLTGDLSPNHVNEEAMRASPYGGRIAHGALLVGYMSNCSTQICERTSRDDTGEMPVSLGYDRLRFLRGVRLGDTVTVTYTVEAVDTARRRSVAAIHVTNQRGELVAAGQHILKWVPNQPDPARKEPSE